MDADRTVGGWLTRSSQGLGPNPNPYAARRPGRTRLFAYVQKSSSSAGSLGRAVTDPRHQDGQQREWPAPTTARVVESRCARRENRQGRDHRASRHPTPRCTTRTPHRRTRVPARCRFAHVGKRRANHQRERRRLDDENRNRRLEADDEADERQRAGGDDEPPSVSRRAPSRSDNRP